MTAEVSVVTGNPWLKLHLPWVEKREAAQAAGDEREFRGPVAPLPDLDSLTSDEDYRLVGAVVTQALRDAALDLDHPDKEIRFAAITAIAFLRQKHLRARLSMAVRLATKVVPKFDKDGRIKNRRQVEEAMALPANLMRFEDLSQQEIDEAFAFFEAKDNSEDDPFAKPKRGPRPGRTREAATG